MKNWIRKVTALILIGVLLFPMLPQRASAEDAAWEDADTEIYYSDLFYGYSHLYLNSDSLYNYAMDTTTGMMSICDDYIDSPSFFWTAVSSTISSSTDPVVMLQWMSDAAVGTDFNYNDALDAANAKFAKELLNKSSFGVAETFGIGSKITGKFEAAMDAWDECEKLLGSKAITQKEAIIKFLNMLGEVKALKKIPTSKITALIEDFELNGTIEMMLGHVDDAAEAAQALITALAIEDLRMELILDIRNHAPSNSTLYDGMNRLSNQLSMGFVGYFMDSYMTEKYFSDMVKKTIKVFDYTAAAMTYKLVTGVLDVASTVVLDLIFNVPSADDFFEQVILTNYAAEMYSAVRSKYTMFAELETFTSKNVLEYEDMVRGLIAITNAGLDATKKITLSSNDIVLETLIDFYGDYSYETYVDSVRSAISAIEPHKRVTKVIDDNSYYEERLVFHAASDNVEEGFFYLFQDSLNFTHKISLYDAEFVFDKSVCVVTIPVDMYVAADAKLTGENTTIIIDGDIVGSGGFPPSIAISVSEGITLIVRDNITIDHGDRLDNAGTLIVEGDVCLEGYHISAYSESRFSVLFNSGTVVVHGNFDIPKLGAIRNSGELTVFNNLTINSWATATWTWTSDIFLDSGRTTVVGSMDIDGASRSSKVYHQTEEGTLVVISELIKRCKDDEWQADGVVRNTSVHSTEVLIDNIAPVTLESASFIETTREVYERLPEEEKNAVTNYELLLEAEQQLDELIEAEKAIAASVIDKIDEIGMVTTNSNTSIKSARYAYDALTPYQKEFVTNYDVLVAAENAMTELVELYQCDHISLYIDFKKAALDSKNQQWRNGGETTGVNTVGFGTVYENSMSSEESEAYEQMCAWLFENYGWTVNEAKTGLLNSSNGKNLWLNADSNAAWGIAFDNLFFTDGKNETAFDIYVENEGEYLFELDMVKHKASDKSVSNYTGSNAGGPYVDVCVNDARICDNYYFGDSNGRCVENLASIYLQKGTNTISFKHMLNYSGHAGQEGYCTTALCGFSLVGFNTTQEREIEDYVDNGNGSHSLVGICSCGAPLASYEICYDADDDELCDRCGSFVCAHKEPTTTYTRGNDETHSTLVTCDACESIIVPEKTNNCVDGDYNSYCDQCGGDVICDHNEFPLFGFFVISNGDNTHTSGEMLCYCGEILDPIVSDCTDTNCDGYCDECDGKIMAPDPITIAGSNMTLGNELVLNFLVKQTDVDADDLTAYVIHHRLNMDTGEMEDVVYEHPQASWVAQGAYYKIPVKVAAAEMTDTVEIEIRAADGTLYNNTYSDSVVNYFKRLYAKITVETVKPLIVDMLNYGAAAQKYFGYRTDTLANAGLTEEQLALATPGVECVNEQEKDDNYRGTSLSLKDRVEINFIFRGLEGKDISTMYAEVSFVDVLGEEKNFRLSGEALTSLNSGKMCQVKLTDLVLADASQLVTVTLYVDGVAHSTVKDSVESYISRYVAQNGDDTGLYGDIMKLSKSAHAYVESKQ